MGSQVKGGCRESYLTKRVVIVVREAKGILSSRENKIKHELRSEYKMFSINSSKVNIYLHIICIVFAYHKNSSKFDEL
jgi:hypothetical protein